LFGGDQIEGIVDIHSHILPGIDDGARDVEESVAMLRTAHAEGVRAVIATPHHYPDIGVPARDQARRLCALIRKTAGLPVDVRAGQEVAADPSVVGRLKEDRVLLFEGARYLLVEPPFIDYPAWVDTLFDDLQAMSVKPIIAHPERCIGIQRDPAILARLVGRGIVSQVNAASLLGDHGPEVQKTAHLLLESGLFHVMASDAHAARGPRASVLGRAVEVLCEIVGQAQAQTMVVTVPQAIMDGRDIAQVVKALG
jgi:protein-tyrosine phosphatase